jgi:hypothetical protein
MPSRALQEWRTNQRLDPYLAGRRLSPTGPEMRQFLVDACIVFLAAHFQRYCRGVYAEAAEFLAQQVHAGGSTKAVDSALMDNTRLGRSNAQAQVLEADFKRLGLDLWAALKARDPRNEDRKKHLARLHVWRNAIAHQSFQLSPGQAAMMAGFPRNARILRTWRRSCSALVDDIDTAVMQHLVNLAGKRPW